MLNDAINLDH